MRIQEISVVADGMPTTVKENAKTQDLDILLIKN